MQRFSKVAVFAPLALGACAALGSYSGSKQDTVYECSQLESAIPVKRTVTVGLGSAGALVLVIGNKPQVLQPVSDQGGHLYASSRYGWRVAGSEGVLTDIETVQLSRCRPIGRPPFIQLNAPAPGRAGR